MRYRTATVRSCEKIGKHAGLADGSVCPTSTHKGLRLSGAGAFACEPIFSQLLREPAFFLLYAFTTAFATSDFTVYKLIGSALPRTGASDKYTVSTRFPSLLCVVPLNNSFV